MNITVFGSGGWGTALAILLSGNGHNVTLWTKFQDEADKLNSMREGRLLKGVKIPAEIEITTEIPAPDKMDMAVIATPSFAVVETCERLKNSLGRDCIVVCASKGLEPSTSKRFSEVFEDIFGADIKHAHLSGPTHAEEVSRGIPTACVAASDRIDVAEKVQDAFMNDAFRVYTSNDVIGVELGAAIKNVIALCAGTCDGLGFGDNTIAALMTRGLAEMKRLCVALGGRQDTLEGLAGLGDLIVTCTSQHSRNRRAGVLIGSGIPVDEALKQVGAVVEGYYAAEVVNRLSNEFDIEMPIFTEAYKVLYENKDPQIVINELMKRPKKSEHEIFDT
jgi:glycerol-3-phosphate dehydrogenase (NAD(P)+)